MEEADYSATSLLGFLLEFAVVAYQSHAYLRYDASAVHEHLVVVVFAFADAFVAVVPFAVVD